MPARWVQRRFVPRSHGVSPYAGMAIGQRDFECLGRQRIESVERAERVKSSQWLLAASDQLSAMQALACPLSCRTSSRCAISRCQPFGLSNAATSSSVRQLSELRNLASWSIAANNSVDAAAVLAGSIPRSELVFSVLRQPLGMFDHVAVHVDDPQSPIRSCSCHHRTTPAVFAGKEIGFVFGGIATESKANAVVGNQVVLHQIVKGFAGKSMLLRSAIKQSSRRDRSLPNRPT